MRILALVAKSSDTYEPLSSIKLILRITSPE